MSQFGVSKWFWPTNKFFLFSGRATSHVYGSNDSRGLIQYLHFYSPKNVQTRAMSTCYVFAHPSLSAECLDQFTVRPLAALAAHSSTAACWPVDSMLTWQASVALLNIVLRHHAVQPRPRNRSLQSCRPVHDGKKYIKSRWYGWLCDPDSWLRLGPYLTWQLWWGSATWVDWVNMWLVTSLSFFSRRQSHEVCIMSFIYEYKHLYSVIFLHLQRLWLLWCL